MTYNFFNDYSEGAHPRILDALRDTNSSQEMGYGEDRFCREAAQHIQAAINRPDAAVHFVSGGTQANLVVLAALLRPYESIIAPDTAHITIHEAGAIEATGHKIHSVPHMDGKLRPEQIRDVCEKHTDEHMVKPKAVFLSQATELGTIYTTQELEDIRTVCTECHLYLYLDGARVGSALAAMGSTTNLADIARLTDVFYIGGTKNGALFGEAIVICNQDLQQDFRYHLKQRGALLAKGRAVGVQFRELFTQDLYLELARHANDMAGQLAEGLRTAGCRFLALPQTNQIFPILPNAAIDRLKNMYGFYVWSRIDETHSSIRLVTSWATPFEAVEQFLTDAQNIMSSLPETT